MKRLVDYGLPCLALRCPGRRSSGSRRGGGPAPFVSFRRPSAFSLLYLTAPAPHPSLADDVVERDECLGSWWWRAMAHRGPSLAGVLRFAANGGLTGRLLRATCMSLLGAEFTHACRPNASGLDSSFLIAPYP